MPYDMCEETVTATSRFTALAALLIAAATAHGQTATEIVAAADNVRNPHSAFRSTVRFTDYIQGRERDHDTFVVFSKEDPVTRQFRNLVQYAEPARDAGKRVLLDGRSLWFFDPTQAEPWPRAVATFQGANVTGAPTTSDSQISIPSVT